MADAKRGTIVSTIILSVRHIGLWRGAKRNQNHILALIAMFCYFTNYIIQLIALVASKDDHARLFECCSVIFFCGMGILKLFSFYHKRELWLRLLDQMKLLECGQLKRDVDLSIAEYESENEEDNNHVTDLIGDYTKKFMKTSTVLFRIYSFTAIIFIFTPFIQYGLGADQGQPPEEYPHILPSWNPIERVYFSCYVVAVTCEAVAAIYCVTIHITFDLAVIGVIVFICGQFSALLYQSEMIGGRGKILSLSRKRDLRAHLRIIKCHRIHIQLVSLVIHLEKLLQNILGLYFFLTTLTLCSVAIRLKLEKMGVMQLMSLLQYMCATLTQLYIYCSYGDAVYHNSAINAGQGPFGAAIWCLGPKIRREIALLGFGMMRPRRLHAGPFNTVDLPSFIQIVRAAYSYFAVLGNSKQE